MFCEQFLAYAVHIDRSVSYAIHKHSSWSQVLNIYMCLLHAHLCFDKFA